MSRKVLVVDDEKLIEKGIRFNLEKDGMDVDCAYDGEEAVEKAKEKHYDIILLDLMLPKMDGLEVCQQISEFSNVPIVMLTAKGEDMDKILGLDYGADDYITKPFNILEVKARIKAIMRRVSKRDKNQENEKVIVKGEMKIDCESRRVIIGEKEINLTEDGQILELEAENEPVQLPTGQITIIKKILESEITWAHGNPTFSFVIEGTDIRGNKRKYEDSVVFMQDAYQVDGNGYAFLEVTISNIPLGTYQVYEKPVLRYYLKKAQANTSNVEIIKGREPAYGVAPVDIAYGTVGLDKDHQKASITFYNRKKRYDGYSHNSLAENTLPVIKSQS